MASSVKPRKKKPRKAPNIAKYMAKRAEELKEFLDNFNEQNQNMVSYDLVLRVMLNRYRVLALRENYPDIWNKHIGQYLKEELRPLTNEEHDHLLLLLYTAAVTKNTHLKNYRELVTGPIEKIRALHAVCINRDPAHISKMKGRELELEADIAGAYSDMLAVTETMTSYISMAQDIIEFAQESIEGFEAYDKALIAANQEHLKTLPTGAENKPAFRKEEVEIEDIIIKILEPRRQEFIDKLNKMAEERTGQVEGETKSQEEVATDEQERTEEKE